MSRLDPIAEFLQVYARAGEDAPFDVTACTLATSGADGRPTARMVLLKKVDERGFSFFTNYASRKARQLAENPQAALCFHWPWIEEQVRVEGRIEILPAEESDAYYRSRGRGSQLGAWASRQSEPMPSRAALLWRVAKVEARHVGGAVPRPPFWGGYLLVPDRIELWHGRPDRLHDRHLFLRQDDEWTDQRLYP